MPTFTGGEELLDQLIAASSAHRLPAAAGSLGHPNPGAVLPSQRYGFRQAGQVRLHGPEVLCWERTFLLQRLSERGPACLKSDRTLRGLQALGEARGHRSCIPSQEPSE